jgi:hypothetical protein
MLFICGGFSEASLAVQTIAVIVALGLSWTSANRSLHRILVVSFAATVASAAAVYLAPGNIVRQGWIGATSPWPTAIVRAWWNAGACTVRFIVWRPAPAFSAFAAGWLVTKWNASSLDGAAAFRQVQHGARVYLPTALVILAASFLPAAFALSDYPPSRAWIVPQFVLVLAVFACGCSCAAAPAEMRILTARSLQVLFYTLLIAAPLWSLFQTVERHADAAWYAKLWDRRDGRLRAYVRAGQLDVVLDPLPEDLGLSRRLSIPKESPDVASFYGLRTSREDKSNQDGVEPFRREWWWTRVAYPQNFQSTIIHRLRGIRSFW